jgi:hypothetical protein
MDKTEKRLDVSKPLIMKTLSWMLPFTGRIEKLTDQKPSFSSLMDWTLLQKIQKFTWQTWQTGIVGFNSFGQGRGKRLL